MGRVEGNHQGGLARLGGMESEISAAARGGTGAARVIRSGSFQTIPGDAAGSTFTKVAFNEVSYDFGGYAADPDDLVVPTDGIYVAVTTLQLANVDDGKSAAVRLNAGDAFNDRKAAAQGAAFSVMGIARIARGTTINVTVAHSDTVSTVNLAAGASLAVFRLSRR